MPPDQNSESRLFCLNAGPFPTLDDHLEYVRAICEELHSELVDLGFFYEGGIEGALATAVLDYLQGHQD